MNYNRNYCRHTCWHYLATVRLWLAKVCCRITIPNSPSCANERLWNSTPNPYFGDPRFKSPSADCLWWLRYFGVCKLFGSALSYTATAFSLIFFNSLLPFSNLYNKSRQHRQISHKSSTKIIVLWLFQPKLSCFSFACHMSHPRNCLI